MHDCVNNSSQWMNIMSNIIICEWLCAFDSVTMIRLCMVLAGWLAVWLHAFISSCYFMFNHLYICNWVWEFAFGSVVWCNVVWLRVMYVKQYREVLANHSYRLSSNTNFMRWWKKKAFFATSCQAITFMPWFIMICYVAPLPLVVLRFLCVMITWLSWIHMGIYCISTWVCLHV